MNETVDRYLDKLIATWLFGRTRDAVRDQLVLDGIKRLISERFFALNSAAGASARKDEVAAGKASAEGPTAESPARRSPAAETLSPTQAAVLAEFRPRSRREPWTPAQLAELKRQYEGAPDSLAVLQVAQRWGITKPRLYNLAHIHHWHRERTPEPVKPPPVRRLTLAGAVDRRGGGNHVLPAAEVVKIKDSLAAGNGIRGTSRATGHARATVTRYAREAKAKKVDSISQRSSIDDMESTRATLDIGTPPTVLPAKSARGWPEDRRRVLTQLWKAGNTYAEIALDMDLKPAEVIAAVAQLGLTNDADRRKAMHG